MKRRTFLRSSVTAGLLLTPVRHLLAHDAAGTYRKNIGIQLYTLRNQIARDVAATMKAVAEAGYIQGELYGFPNADKMIRAARDAGLELHSAHFDSGCAVAPKDDALSDFQRILDKAKETGLTHLVVPYLDGGLRKNLDGYKRVADNLNKAAAKARAVGIQLAYHNHAFEFQPMENGKSGYDVFIETFTPEMQFEIDIFWAKAAGIEPAELIQKLSGRVSQLHIKDLKDGTPIPTFGGVPNDAFKELGQGIIPIGKVLETAAAAGVKICHVEQDQSPDPLASIRQSMEYLRKL